MGLAVGGRLTREGTYVNLWLIHVDIWQKSTQYCKAIILQLKIKTFLKRGKLWLGAGCEVSLTLNFFICQRAQLQFQPPPRCED